MQPDQVSEILNRPISQELLARDVARLGYVAKDGTPRTIPIGFAWNGAEIVMCTTKNAPKVTALRRNPAVALTIDTEVVTPAWAKLIDFETTLPSPIEELIRQRDERQRA
jgi:nitroimidazol reductase NimA-like FMN-containing flavoprotein (pyridoxamine 5'-phosphate oxidase superfamily)